MDVTRHIILFDGVCNLCNDAVRFVIKCDPKKVFKFASLQSEVGKMLLKEYGLPIHCNNSFVYVKGGEAYTKSDAALKVAAMLSYPTKLMSWFIVFPRFIRDFGYDLIARNRYKIFGKKDECMVPTPELKERFL